MSDHVKCKHCDVDIEELCPAYGTMLNKEIERRLLTAYGFYSDGRAEIYRATTAIRGTIKVLLGEFGQREHIKWNLAKYDAAIDSLNQILPEDVSVKQWYIYQQRKDAEERAARYAAQEQKRREERLRQYAEARAKETIEAYNLRVNMYPSRSAASIVEMTAKDLDVSTEYVLAVLNADRIGKEWPDPGRLKLGRRTS